VLLALFTVSSLNAIRSWISKAARNKGTIYGLFYAGTALSASLGALVMGVAWERWGSEQAIGISISGLLGMWWASLYLISRKKML
jgi:hypothetical protein